MFTTDPALAATLDVQDPLRSCRDLFAIPPAANDPKRPCVYLTGNSLGLMPRATPAAVQAELEDWARLGVDAHLHGRHPWLPYHEFVREPLARLVGAMPREVVAMNSLTVNLHLLMVSFYRPTPERHRIVIEDSAFPSDAYAVASQASFRGFDPSEAIVRLKPREGEAALRADDIEAFLDREGRAVALVLLGAVNYLSGQWFDMPRITAAAKKQGCIVGWDLAHAAGNVPVRLHDWNVDFAAWCSYKYLNSGPGAVAGAFVHERWVGRRSATGPRRDASGHPDLPRFAGWWGTDPKARFEMRPDFVPVESADAWQLSNPPILSTAPLRVSLDIFDRATMPGLREKSLRLTAYMEFLVERLCGDRVRVLTPRDPAQRGGQLSLAVPGRGRDLERALLALGVVVDFREPDVVRAAPVPLYNTFEDVQKFITALRDCA